MPLTRGITDSDDGVFWIRITFTLVLDEGFTLPSFFFFFFLCARLVQWWKLRFSGLFVFFVFVFPVMSHDEVDSKNTL